MQNLSDTLTAFLPPVQQWFRSALGEPTPVQRQSWPVIAYGENALLLAPTGSGKTLAAFMACLDWLWRQETIPSGVQILYVSPLKALNNDIHRNLQLPLQGVRETADAINHSLPDIDVGVRTGDTPNAERQRMIRKPPQILITTPESLHLLLTSKARETLRSVRYCIVDEIHAMCPNKRGVFLSLLLERLQAINENGRMIRIGLSATQRPLETVAQFLGGCGDDGSPRPVTIVDAGLRKDLDVKVVSPVDSFYAMPEKSIWPSIYRYLHEQISAHRSTIVFANNRRTVERLTAQINAIAEEQDADSQPVRAHHGSVSLEARQVTEQALKDGRLSAVAATASLELGIDMGAVDLVCQVESTGNVARGLQRVGRAGHLVGQKSKGRLVPKTQTDLLNQVVLAGEMIAGRVEKLSVPINCLDVLAQQIVAMVAMEEWSAPLLFELVRRSFPYRTLTAESFEAVLEMISGRYQFSALPDDEATPRPQTLAALEPRISWDRVHNRLLPLPGSQRWALTNGGTIPDTGQYAVYTNGRVRIGELDEEFIYERRIGDTFLLGTNVWRLEDIENDRVIVSPAPGAPAMVPFWRGEQTGRSFDLGVAQGRFLTEIACRIDNPDCVTWLKNTYPLDMTAARQLRDFVRRQMAHMEKLPTDKTLVVEACRDQLGDWQVYVLSPLGSRMHLGLRLAVERRLHQRLGYRPQCLHHDDGILIRLSESEQPVLDVLDGITADNVQQLILDELADSALFALRFRQNAARALLMPRTQVGKRAPLWLQRIRGRDLLQVARKQPDFPIVAETFRECFHDHLDLPRLRDLLRDIAEKRVEVIQHRSSAPSPFAASLQFHFEQTYMYQYDGSEAAVTSETALNKDFLDRLIGAASPSLSDPRAVEQLEQRLRGFGRLPRNATETAEWLRRLGDLSEDELHGPMREWAEELCRDGRAVQLELPNCRYGQRWILAEEEALYRSVFLSSGSDGDTRQRAAEQILLRFLNTRALVDLETILQRYPFERRWAEQKLREWSQSGRVVAVESSEPEQSEQYASPGNWEQIQRGTLAIRRREVLTCSPIQFSAFLLRWQRVIHQPESERDRYDDLEKVLERFQGLALPLDLWESAILPLRVADFRPQLLEEVLASGQWLWSMQPASEKGKEGVVFHRRDRIQQFASPESEDGFELHSNAQRAVDALRAKGASFVADIAGEAGLSIGEVRNTLQTLLTHRIVTNDRIDAARLSNSEIGDIGNGRRARAAWSRGEGRWSLLPWEKPDVETQAVAWAEILLQRYGVVTRDLAMMESTPLPWRVLYEVLSRLEWADKVRRGYFVEGMSGAQFASPEAVGLLQDTQVASSNDPMVMIHSQDPANLFGVGAPFDIPLLANGSKSFPRRPGNWLVVHGGRPILLIEKSGGRISALASAKKSELNEAVACLPQLLKQDPRVEEKKKLTVETWNDIAVTETEGAELLKDAGFVRDYRAMTLYGAWR